MFRWRQYQQDGGVFIQFNSLMNIELMPVSLLLTEAKVFQEEVNGWQEGVLQELGVGDQQW